MKTYTIVEAAEILGKNRQVVERACRKLEIPKFGPAYQIDLKTLALLRRSIKSVGQPKKGKA